MKNLQKPFILIVIIISLASCRKYQEYNNLDVIEETFAGSFDVSSSSGTLNGSFDGAGNSGSYCFIWENNGREAIVVLESSGSTGSINVVIEDARANEVFNEVHSAGSETGLAEASDKGRKGNWFVKIFFTDFEGAGTFSINN